MSNEKHVGTGNTIAELEASGYTLVIKDDDHDDWDVLFILKDPTGNHEAGSRRFASVRSAVGDEKLEAFFENLNQGSGDPSNEPDDEPWTGDVDNVCDTCYRTFPRSTTFQDGECPECVQGE